MKRLLKLFSLFVIILFATLTISSCGKKKEVVNQSEVKLISFGEPTKDNTRKKLRKSLSIREKDETSDISLSGENTIDYQFILIPTSEEDVEVEIKLENPKDYVILNLELESNNENVEIKTDNGYKKLSTLKSINWTGYTNDDCIYTFKTNNINMTNITIKNILYIDKVNASVVYSADLNKKETVEIYRQDFDNSIKIDIDKCSYKNELYKLNFAVSDFVRNLIINDIKIEASEYVLETKDIKAITMSYDIVAIDNENITKSFTYSFDNFDSVDRFFYRSVENGYYRGYNALVFDDSDFSRQILSIY